MAGKVLKLDAIIEPDSIAQGVARNYITWNLGRASKISAWNEVRQYVYATDTSTTTNAKLPWKNKTTTPKLCQIRENLYANYYATLFPKREWLTWESGDKESDTAAKKEMIENYMFWITDQPEFYTEVQKMLLDYVDYGNVIAGCDWKDQTVEGKNGKIQKGFKGPVPLRISPIDIVFNPIAPSFQDSPKIIKSVHTLGELKLMVDDLSKYPEQAVDAPKVFDYLKNLRQWANSSGGVGDLSEKDAYLMVDGFTSYRHYLESDNVELLTFYGDAYDKDSDKIYRNSIITVADRHKLISVRPNPSTFGKPSLNHVGWRPRQDNLWAMGPLDNLVGMQYRIDHIENLKADCFDLLAFPPVQVKGYVGDFTWQPFEKIYVGDEGSVQPFPPDVQILQANSEIEQLMNKMEEMAGAPKEAMGFRNPGEKTMYEVQRMENAYTRIFHSKISQFEQFILEPMLNNMLELAIRNMTDAVEVPFLDKDYNVVSFKDVTADDLTGVGRIRPVAARHFAEKAEVVQNLTNLFNSPLGADPNMMMHWSTVAMSKMLEEMFQLKQYQIVKPYIRLAEQAEAQQKAHALQEQVQMAAGTPSGSAPDDFTPGQAPGIPPQGAATQ